MNPQNKNDLLQQTYEDISMAGSTWAMVYDSVAERMFCFGKGEPDDNWNIRLASVSKLVVGRMYVGCLDRGIVQPDSLVSDILREWSEPLSGLTVKDLATHQTGLRDALEDPAFRHQINKDVSRPVPLDEVIKASLSQPLIDTRPNYKNINAILLALVLERVSGQTLQALTRSFFPDLPSLTLQRDGKLPKPHLMGHRFGAAPGLIEYGDTRYKADHYNAAWSGAAGAFTLKIKHVSAFGPSVMQPLAAHARQHSDGFVALAQLKNGWVFHPGDLPGFSAWAGLEMKTDRFVFAAAGTSWIPDIGNPAERMALAVVPALRTTEQ